jgi:hypothetical protein
MAALKANRITELTFLLFCVVATAFYQIRAMRGKNEPMRRMEQIEAISGGVDKAVEEGKPVFVGPGNMAYLSGLYATMTISGLDILRYTARLCVRKGARVIFPVPCTPETLPLIDGIFREVCVSEGKPEAYRREDVHYYGSSESSYAIGVGDDIASNGCSLGVFTGANSSAEMYACGTTRQQGGMVIFGTPRYSHQSTAFAMADYPLFCEDLYGAGAYASGDPIVAASMAGEDIIKLAFVVIGTIVFTVLVAVGMPLVTKTTGWLLQ